jgi:DNA-directed RNA polymerase subunit RPC12/RpoP
LAKLVECVICGNHFAITDKDEKKIQDAVNSLKTENLKLKGEVEYICKICKKMVKTN